MKIKDHLKESLKLAPSPTPVPRMILCALGVTLPLVVGYFLNDEASAIYGALFGFTLILNDHFGPLGKRIIHLLTAYLFLVCAFGLGILLSGHLWPVMIALFIMAFLVGKSKGIGLELERMLITSTFQFLTASQTPELKTHYFKPLLYASFSLANYILCLFIIYLMMKHGSNFQKSKRREFMEAIKKRETQRYALTLAIVTCIGLFISNYFHIKRGQWMVSTILIVMMPSKTQSFHRSFQRILGTFLGGFIASLIIYLNDDSWILILFSSVAAFLAPLGLIRNYWLGNTFIAALIMFFLEIGSMQPGHHEFDIAILRLMDIALGSIIGAIGTIFAFSGSLKSFFKSKE